jgi:hypothetical protein
VVALAGLAILVATAIRRANEPATFATAVLVSILVAPAVYHHYLALLVLPFLLGLAAGVRIRWLALAYFLMWGGQQTAAGEFAWILNKGLPTVGALVLLAAVGAAANQRRLTTQTVGVPAGDPATG